MKEEKDCSIKLSYLDHNEYNHLLNKQNIIPPGFWLVQKIKFL